MRVVLLVSLISTFTLAMPPLPECPEFSCPYCEFGYKYTHDDMWCPVCECLQDPCLTSACYYIQAACRVVNVPCSGSPCQTKEATCLPYQECDEIGCDMICEYGQKVKNGTNCRECIDCPPDPCESVQCEYPTRCELRDVLCSVGNCPKRAVCVESEECPQMLCFIDCPYGFLYDSNGCRTCQCRSDPCQYFTCPESLPFCQAEYRVCASFSDVRCPPTFPVCVAAPVTTPPTTPPTTTPSTTTTSTRSKCPATFGARACQNACAQKGLTCCYCESNDYFLSSETCACCPMGSTCCNYSYLSRPMTGTTPQCCPSDMTCQADGKCMRKEIHPGFVSITKRTPLRGQLIHSTCAA